MESFDQSLKYLLQHEPEDFIRFGLGAATVNVVAPVPTSLPSRGRDVDGSYLLEYNGARLVAHIEFHRRNQSQEELAVDVVEAQVRLFRRERLPVLSHVWDLYGQRDEPVLQERTLHFGALWERAHSLCVYHRVNLRGLSWPELLAMGLPGLWPLVALTRDGASEEAVRQARDAITGRRGLGATGLADHLTVLSFIAEAEGVPVQALRAYIPKEELMASTLYQEILAEGEARGEARGEERGEARGAMRNQKETVIRILTHRLDGLEPAVRERIQTLDSAETLTDWYEEALQVVDAKAARKLVEKIMKALPA